MSREIVCAKWKELQEACKHKGTNLDCFINGEDWDPKPCNQKDCPLLVEDGGCGC